jgi:hypothetical protein
MTSDALPEVNTKSAADEPFLDLDDNLFTDAHARRGVGLRVTFGRRADRKRGAGDTGHRCSAAVRIADACSPKSSG